jgi:UDP-glucose 4-epimerase
MLAHPQNSQCVLITGGRGAIGRAAGKLLQRAGYRILACDRNPPDGVSADPTGEIVCDITDELRLRAVFETHAIGRILHLAAILPTAAQRDPALATRVNLAGTLHLLELARGFGVARFVLASSLSVYGTVAADHTVSELDRPAPEDIYGTAKLYGEQMGELYRRGYGLEFAGLRIGRVVGPGTHSLSSAWRSQIFECLASTRPVEIPIPYRSEERILLTHIEDVAQMLCILLDGPGMAHTIYNAPAESFLVADLKHAIESSNPNVRLKTGPEWATGNPRHLNASRFRDEFHFQAQPIRQRLRAAALG